MKKAYTFIRSMRFGMLLLAGIGILCILATVSGNEKIYSSWYFILLFAVLGLNLSLCSFQRVFHLKALKLALVKKAENSPDVLPVPDAEAWLRRHRFVRQKDGSLLKNRAGFLGSSLTHGAMLLLMLSAGFIFAFAQREDLLLCVGDTAELPDGTQITVGDFRLEDESGRTEYLSELSAVLPDGNSMEGSVRVNHPLRVGRYTVYQQNYSYAAVIGVSTETNREEETVKLSEAAFLSLDGENGIYYSQMFGNVAEENGEVRVSHGQELVHPAYEVIVREDGGEQSGLVYPGTTLSAGGIFCSFREPEACPGLRVKTQPEWALWLLYLSFGLMTAGLYLCFFCIPEAAHVRAEGIAIAGSKDISLQVAQYRAELQGRSGS